MYILFGGWDVVFVGVVVRVAVLFNSELGGFPILCFLGFGSSYVGCVGCIASDVRLFRERLRFVYGGGYDVLVGLCMSLIRWDLRCVMAGAWLGWRFGIVHGCIVSVLRSSFMICLMLRSSSPVRANRRYICESWCAWVCVWRRTGIAPW